MKISWNGTTIANANATEDVEGNNYFPRSSVKWEHLQKSSTPYTCPWKGVCTYYDLAVGGETLKDAAWSYEDPKPAASHIAGHVAFDNRVERS